PLFPDLPESLEALIVEGGGGPGPHGAKGVAEGAIIPVAPAIANAVAAATGARIRDLPLTPERVWRALPPTAPDSPPPPPPPAPAPEKGEGARGPGLPSPCPSPQERPPPRAYRTSPASRTAGRGSGALDTGPSRPRPSGHALGQSARGDEGVMSSTRPDPPYP